MSKKGSKPQPKEQSYEIRDVVLAKVRGFPPWPGMIVDPASVPKIVVKERPNAKSKKGVWYCVRFFPAGDYAWLVPKDISKLQKHEIQAYIDEPFKRSGDLLAGYRIALDPTKWEEEREAASAQLAELEADAEIDQLDSDGAEEQDGVGEDDEDDDEDSLKKKSKSKKRKRESEGAAPTTKKGAGKGGRKKDSAEPAAKKKGAGKGKKNGAKSKTLVESEDEAQAEVDEEDAGPSKKAASPPPAKKVKRDKDEDEADPELAKDPEAQKVRDWRHKLQKAFLNSKVQPKDEDMPLLDELFTTVESYDKMSVIYLSFSKIGKVMRHIHALTPERVPRDEEFKFRERANVLVQKWHDIINANKTSQANGDSATSTDPVSSKPSANGKADGSSPGATAKKESKGANGSVKDMDVDAKADEPVSDEVAETDANAEGEISVEATGAGDESVLADVTMSEAAA